MRPLSLLLAWSHVAGSTVAALVLVVIATVPLENTTGNESWRAAFLAIAPLLFVLGVGTGVAVARRKQWAFATLALHLAVGLSLLAFALGESTHSDDKLLLAACAIEFPGVFGVLLNLE